MRFLFCALASHGYVYPAINIAQQLLQRGHEVAFVTGRPFAEVLAEAEIERIPFGAKDGDSFAKRFFGNPAEIVRQVKHISYAHDYFDPDVLIGTPLTFGPLVAAKKFQLPVATIGYAAYLWPTTHSLSGFLPTSGKEEYFTYRHSRMLSIFAEICNLFGLTDPRDSFSDLDNTPLIGDMHLLRSLPELQGDIDELPERVHLVGDCLWEPPAKADAELEAWLDESPKEPLLYVQHVSGGEGIPDYWPNLIEALRGQPVRVAAAVNQISVDIASLPDNFFVRPNIPYASVLPRARAVICAGTTNSVLHPLALGLPLLLIPIGGEQPDVAYRCEQAGVAHCLYPFNVYTRETMPEAVSVSMLSQTIQALLSDDNPVRLKAQKMQQALAYGRDQPTAAVLLEQLALEGSYTSQKVTC